MSPKARPQALKWEIKLQYNSILSGLSIYIIPYQSNSIILCYIFTVSGTYLQITSRPNHLFKAELHRLYTKQDIFLVLAQTHNNSQVECTLRTYTAEDFGGQVLVKLSNDDSHIVILKKRKTSYLKRYEHFCITQNVIRSRLNWLTVIVQCSDYTLLQ